MSSLNHLTELNYVCEVFDWISLKRSRHQKLAGLNQIKSCGGKIEEIAREMFSIALDWYRHYGIGNLPNGIPPVGECGWDPFLEMVKNLEMGLPVSKEIVAGKILTNPPMVQKWLSRCILKDLRMGVAESTVNQIWPGLIEYFEVQLADSLSDPESLCYPVLVEPKIDGVRAVAVIKPGKVEFITRTGRELWNMHAIEKAILEMFPGKSLILDGEAFTKDLRKTLGVVKSSKSDPDPDDLAHLCFYVFDILTPEEWEHKKCIRSQHERIRMLRESLSRGQLAVKPVYWPDSVEMRVATCAKDVSTFCDEAIAAGYEGVMVKQLHGVYSWGRTSAWLKYKPFDIAVFEVIGYYKGTGRHEDRLGGLTLAIKHPQLEFKIQCNVGGGFSDEQRTQLWQDVASLPGKRARVKFKEFTPDGKLREPVFLNFVDE